MIKEIPTSIIYPGERARALVSSNVDVLASSMAENGLINPIIVKPTNRYHGGILRDCFEIVAGGHRYRAAVKLGWEEITCKVVDMDDLHIELVEIDENLARSDLSPAQQAAAVARRKEIYEALHPETKHGGNSSGDPCGRFRHTEAERFTAATAKATGKAERTIREAAARGKALGSALGEIAGTSLDKGREIDALIKMKPEERRELIDRAKGGENVSAHEAPADSFEKELARLKNAWNAAGAKARRKFLILIKADRSL